MILSSEHRVITDVDIHLPEDIFLGIMDQGMSVSQCADLVGTKMPCLRTEEASTGCTAPILEMVIELGIQVALMCRTIVALVTNKGVV